MIRKQLLLLVFTAFCMANFASNRSDTLIQDYILKGQLDSARWGLKHLEKSEKEELYQSVVNSEKKDYQVKSNFLKYISRVRQELSVQQITFYINENIKKPTVSEGLNSAYCEILFWYTTWLRNRNELNLASQQNLNFQEYVNQFDKETEKVLKTQLLVDNHSIVMAQIQAEYAEMKQQVQRNIKIAEKLNDTNSIILGLYQLSDYYVANKEVDTFISVTERAIKLDELQQKKSDLYYGNISHILDAYIYKGGYNEKVKDLLDVLYKNQDYRTESLSFYAKFLRFNKDKSEIQFILEKFECKNVEEFAFKVKDLIKEEEEPMLKYHTMRELAPALVNHRFYDYVDKFYLSAIQINSEIYSNKLSKSLAKYETDLVKQEKELEVQHAEDKSNLYLLIAILALCFFGLLAVLFIINLKKNKVLGIKNGQIAKALGEKKLLLKEMHHRVKNNFLTVSSLLELQSKDIEDVKARELAEEGQNRVKSMALIHEKLYKNDDFNIDFNKYVKELVNEITRTYGENKNTQIEYAIEDNLSFDIDTAIPLGLIVNELITNAYKYGGSDENPKVSVKVKRLDSNFHQLVVEDNGKGLPADFNFSTTTTMGLRLVKNFSRQLQGKAKFEFTDHSIFTVLFKDTISRMQID